MKYKCVIFDCDGVLVDSEFITAKVLVAMGKDLGLHMDLDFVVGEFLGKSLNDIMHYLDVLAKGGLPPDFESEYRKKTFEVFKNELKPIEGVHSVIESLKIPFCVASSGPLEKIRANLTTTGLINKFEGRMFSCYEIQSWKPNPDIFLHAAKNMGFKPKECAVIEDSKVGVQAALAGGFDVFVYSKNGHDHPVGVQETFVFQDMSELKSLLSHSL